MEHIAYITAALRPHRRRLIITLLAAGAMTVADLGSPLVVAVLVDVVVGHRRYELLAPLMVLFLLLPFATAVCRTVADYLMTLVGQRLVLDIRLDLYRRVHRLSCRFLQNTTTGKLMERLRGDVQQLQMVLTNETPTLLIQLVTGLIMVGVMFFLSTRLTLLVLAAIGLYVANYKWFVRRIRKVQRRYRHKMDRLSAVAQERLTGNIVVKTFGNERRESRRFLRLNFTTERVHHRFRLLNVAYNVSSSAIGWSSYLLVTLLGAHLAVTGQMTFGQVIAMTAFTMRLMNPALKLSELSNQIQQAKVALDRIFELMQAPADAINRAGIKLPALRGEVTFENICFQYEPGQLVLEHFNLYVQPGQTVALVGQTGCGKTTITNLLYRYHEPQAGHLTVDGHDIWHFDTRWYRRQLAIVAQDPTVFDTTIRHNIAYGNPNAPRHRIEQAVRMVELHELVDRLSLGIDTPLGDDGLKMSVGERQRLCIARTIVADPVILILDEATSSLDPHSEMLVQLAMRRAMKRRTCFVIAHRLSTIVEADLIVMLDHGRVIEMGNHVQLMSRRQGRYRAMFEAQIKSRHRLEVA